MKKRFHLEGDTEFHDIDGNYTVSFFLKAGQNLRRADDHGQRDPEQGRRVGDPG